jgi:hypothetical protein
MAELFDIQFVTTHFSTCNLSYYLELLEEAPIQDLSQFRKQVQVCAKQSQTSQAYSNTPWLTCHGAIIAAIDQQILKRSPIQFKFWCLILPVRKFLVARFSGMELETPEFFGAIYSTPKHRRSVWHMPHRELATVLRRFVGEYQKAIVTAVLSIITAVVVKWLAL